MMVFFKFKKYSGIGSTNNALVLNSIMKPIPDFIKLHDNKGLEV